MSHYRIRRRRMDGGTNDNERPVRHKRYRAMREFDRAIPFIRNAMAFLMFLRFGEKPADLWAKADTFIKKTKEELEADNIPDADEDRW